MFDKNIHSQQTNNVILLKTDHFNLNYNIEEILYENSRYNIIQTYSTMYLFYYIQYYTCVRDQNAYTL